MALGPSWSAIPLSPGLPLAPVELEVRGDTAHQLTLSWGPPFTLPGETVSYSLLIEDLATGHTETETLSDTVYTHSLSEAEALACHSFLFSVSSVNDVGSSLNSSSVQAVHPSGRQTQTHFVGYLVISLPLWSSSWSTRCSRDQSDA